MIDDLIKEGKIVADSRTPLARTGLAIAIRAGSRKPDIATVEAFKRSLLGAKSIAYAREGASGEAEFGVLPVSEILPIRGAELAGTFPVDLQSYIVMVAGVSAGARQGNAARDLVGFLAAPAALPVIKAKGMERNVTASRTSAPRR